MVSDAASNADDAAFAELLNRLQSLPPSPKRDESLTLIQALGPAGVAALRRLSAERQQAEQACRRFEDPDFGVLAEETYCWSGEIPIPASSLAGGSPGPVRLELLRSADTSRAGPSDGQRAAFQAIRARWDSLQVAVCQANFEYYNRVKASYRDGLDEEEIEEFVPDLASAVDILRLLCQPTVQIPYQSLGERRVRLIWECTWDDEHGHQLELSDETIIGVGRP